eukprot:TRINITY_DN59609_c0_g2_i2.p1 TRINITY_DN59609_c0_g2~~TRINITY_DN59609_c0_g2_i2.p1  ORF type:complete len:583 (-),score=145.29 TRINITY_DN59609_c0_g2_i2:119-1867(-)
MTASWDGCPLLRRRRCHVLFGVVAFGSGIRPAGGRSGFGPLPRTPDLPVLAEPSVQDHYGFLREYNEVPFKDFQRDGGPPVLRVTNLDDERFQQLVRDGVPFVVDDCMKDVDADAISKFECKDFAKRWPSGNMRAEYTPGQYHIYLKDPTWYSKLEPTRAHSEHMAKDKKIAGPYIWHVKDEEPLKTKRSVQKHWRTPYFLQRSLANRMEANESFEFWFSMAGGGTFTHADAYCESTISMQFKGKKRWRIQALPEIRHNFNATSFGDSSIYANKLHVPWTPETEFTVGPGECFVFPTGYLHETFVDPEENDGGCYTASTFQFNHPRQVNLYRAYLSRLSMSHYGMQEPCIRGMETYATLMGTGLMKFKGEPDKAQIDQRAATILKEVDTDGDSQATADELHAHFCTGSSRKRVLDEGGFYYGWTRLLSKDQLRLHEEESLRVWAEDALQYHDINRDRVVTVEELSHALLQWHVVQYRLSHAKKATKMKSTEKWLDKMLTFEKAMLQKYYCGESASDCPALEELTRFGDKLKTSKKAAASIKRRVTSMFESEGAEDEEQLTFVDRTTGEQEQKKVGAVKSEEL